MLFLQQASAKDHITKLEGPIRCNQGRSRWFTTSIVQVSKTSFIRALDEKRAVIMIPGGQAELVLASRFFKKKEIVMYTRHKGRLTSEPMDTDTTFITVPKLSLPLKMQELTLTPC